MSAGRTWAREIATKGRHNSQNGNMPPHLQPSAGTKLPLPKATRHVQIHNNDAHHAAEPGVRRPVEEDTPYHTMQ
eukprot:4807792-Lingulodinium_polyedra.AAC.1